MLIPAISVEEDLRREFKVRSLSSELKWYQAGYEDLDLDFDVNSWSRLQIASVHNDVILGYFRASIDRDGYTITGLCCLSFADGPKTKALFAADLRRFLKFLAERKFKKISWTVIVGNPAEASYDRIARKIGARIIGTARYDVFIQGQYYDRKMYEWINDYYECTHCGHRQKKEEEVMCWKCGLGEMVYHNPFEW